ncbi:type III secretion system cytoplasmic ring protein SctQ [Brucella sp. LJL56]
MVAVLANRRRVATTSQLNDKLCPAVEPLRLPEIPTQHIDAVNALNRRRGPVSFSVLDRTFTLGWANYPPDARHEVSLALTTLYGSATLHIPGTLFDDWLERSDSTRGFENMQSADQTLLLEAILDNELNWLEQKLDSGIEFVGVRRRSDHHDDSLLPVVSLKSDCGRDVALTIGSDQLAQKLATLFDHATDPASLFATSVPVPLRILYGATTITLHEMKELEQDDVILPADSELHASRSCCLIGDQLAAPVSAVNGGWHLNDRFLPLTGSEWDFDMATERTTDNSDEDSVAGLADIPVTLVFEAGRVALPLAEVQRLDAGALITLDAPVDNGVSIFASGKRVGRGELVKLGEKLGIRVVNIFNND